MLNNIFKIIKLLFNLINEIIDMKIRLDFFFEIYIDIGIGLFFWFYVFYGF